MITVHQSVNVEEQTVSWRLDVTPPEHEKHGQMCHAFDGAILDDRLRHLLRQLGYILVCSEEKPIRKQDWGYTEYWRRIEV